MSGRVQDAPTRSRVSKGMRFYFVISLTLVAATAAARPVETLTFELPSPDGRVHRVQDFGSRYLLLVYQGIP